VGIGLGHQSLVSGTSMRRWGWCTLSSSVVHAGKLLVCMSCVVGGCVLVLSEDEMELLVVTAASKCRPGVAEGMSTVLERLLKISGTEVEVEGPIGFAGVATSPSPLGLWDSVICSKGTSLSTTVLLNAGSHSSVPLSPLANLPNVLARIPLTARVAKFRELEVAPPEDGRAACNGSKPHITRTHIPMLYAAGWCILN